MNSLVAYNPPTKVLGEHLHMLYTLDPKSPALVVIVHGYGEHSGRYLALVEALVKMGLSVCVYDQRGHGRTGGKKGLVPPIQDLLEDLEIVWLRLRELSPNMPIVLFGHSMGALVASYFVQKSAPSLKALILSGIAIEPKTQVNAAVKWLGLKLGHIAPGLPTVDLKLAPQIARDPLIVESYLKDPLNYVGKIRAGSAAVIDELGRRVLAGAPMIAVPTLMLHGGSDSIASPEAAQAFYDQLSSADKSFRIYPESFHEVLNDYDKQLVLNELLDWLKARL